MTLPLQRAAFFARLRDSGLLGATLSQTEVDGLCAILDAWARLGWPADLRPIAYTMATAWHECRLDLTCREIGLGRGKPYGVAIRGRTYYGRGGAQLTWIDNYREFGTRLDLDLVANPDLALDPGTSAAILVLGCRDGLFRKGRHLARYFDADTDDPEGARDIVNGDGAKNGARIAGYHRTFLACLQGALILPPMPAPAVARTAKPGALGRLVSTIRSNLRKGA